MIAGLASFRPHPTSQPHNIIYNFNFLIATWPKTALFVSQLPVRTQWCVKRFGAWLRILHTCFVNTRLNTSLASSNPEHTTVLSVLNVLGMAKNFAHML